MGNLTVAMYAIVLPTQVVCWCLLPSYCVRHRGGSNLPARSGQRCGSTIAMGGGWNRAGVCFRGCRLKRFEFLMGGMFWAAACTHSQLFKAKRTRGPFSWFSWDLGGFATMIANAAGPVAAFILISMRLPKVVFVGTTAWFLVVN